MVAYGWGREQRGRSLPGGFVVPHDGDGRPRTLNDTERASWDTLGGPLWRRWADRGRWDPPQRWEAQEG